MRVYSLFDRKMKEYMSLVLASNDDVCKRALRESFAGAGMMAKYPEDFDLMCLGSFDAETGQLVPEDVPLLVDNVRTIIGGE